MSTKSEKAKERKFGTQAVLRSPSAIKDYLARALKYVAIDKIPTNTVVTQNMAMDKALSFVTIKYLLVTKETLYAVVKRKDRQKNDVYRVLFVDDKHCILVYNSKDDRNYLIWLE